MKFAKTFCRPGALVTVVPAGLPVKLQYNEHGLLQKFTIGFTRDLDPTYDDASDVEYNYNELFAKIKRFVPNTILTTGGTTWVYGVFYSDSIPCDEGRIPATMYKSYIEDIIQGGTYTFYAGYVHSLAASFKGPLVIRNFLTGGKFNILPQVVVPSAMTDDTLQMMNQGAYPFKYSFIAGYLIFEDMDCRYASSNLIQRNVTNDIEPVLDPDGYLKGKIIAESGAEISFSYSAILHHAINKGSTILLEEDPNDGSLDILSTRYGKNIERVPDGTPKEIKCPVCGKVYYAGQDDAPVQCDDPHCLSRLYPDAVNMLTTLKLPGIDYSEYKRMVDEKEIICLTDILDTTRYENVEIRSTIANAMRSVIPMSAAPNSDIIERFVNKCNNSVESITYYLNHPRRIETDLDIVDPMVRRFVTWLEDPYNVSTLTTIFARVKLLERAAKFEGDPIFRGNSFVITGKFKRGDYEEIASILNSYAAKVSPTIEVGEKLPTAIITGSLNDGISGQVIQKARLHNIQIFDEDTFFTQYEIDQDLAQNLL